MARKIIKAASELSEESQTGNRALSTMLRESLLTVPFLTVHKLNKSQGLDYQLFDKLNKRTCRASYFFFYLGERNNVFHLAKEEKDFHL